MAQQTFSGVPGAFSAGEVLSSADQNLIRDLMVAVIKEGMTGDTGEILPMIMDLTNNRIVLDTGGLEFSNGSTQTIAGMTAAGGTFTGAVGFGSDGSGVDVTIYTATAGDTFLFDASEEKMVITGTDGQNSLEVADGDVSITDQLTVSGGLVAPLSLNNETASYVLVLADAGKMVEVNNGSANNLTIPPNSSVAFPTGTQIIVVQQGAGATTIVEGTGVTTRSLDDNAVINGQYVSVALVKRDTDEWYIFGNLTS